MFVAGSDPDLVEWVVADMCVAPAEIAVNAMEHSISNDGAVLAGLQELTAPIVAINPDHRPTDVEALRRYRVNVVTMPKVGHFMMLEDPATFNRLLGDTIQTLVSSRPRGR